MLDSRAPESLGDPSRGVSHVVLMLGQRGDAGNAQEVTQLIHGRRPARREVGLGGVRHGLTHRTIIPSPTRGRDGRCPTQAGRPTAPEQCSRCRVLNESPAHAAVHVNRFDKQPVEFVNGPVTRNYHREADRRTVVKTARGRRPLRRAAGVQLRALAFLQPGERGVCLSPIPTASLRRIFRELLAAFFRLERRF